MRTLERLRQIVHNARRPTDDELMRTAQEFAQMQQRWVDAALEQVSAAYPKSPSLAVL